MKDKKVFYMKLFLSTLSLSAFTFGGGYVIVPLMKKKFVDELAWIDEREMLDLIAIAQSAPGAMAVNAAILVGYRLAGIIGSLITIIATVLPPLLILSIISMFYVAFRQSEIANALMVGLQAAVAAIIVDVVINMGRSIIKEKNKLSIVMMIVIFMSQLFFHINLLVIILLCGGIGATVTLYRERSMKKVEDK